VQTLKRKPAWMRRWGISELSMSQTVGNGDGVQTPLLRFIGTRRNDLVSTFPGAHISLEEDMHAVEALLRKAVTIHDAELARLDLLDGFEAFLNCIELLEPVYRKRGKRVFYDALHDMRIFLSGWTEEICRVRRVSKVGARAYIRNWAARMISEYDRGNAVVREIIDELKGPGANDFGCERISLLPFFTLSLHNRCAAEKEEESRWDGEGDSYEEEGSDREEVDDVAVAA
jgi:hypothetical protein